MTNNIPALRVVLTSACNLRCGYCPPNGENFSTVESELPLKKLFSILEAFYCLGIRQFGFTGGDPLLRKDFCEVVDFISNFKNTMLKIYTNGVLLKKKIRTVQKFDLIKLGLNTIDKDKFRQISGSNSYEDVLAGISEAQNKGIKIRINTVLTKENAGESFDIINFCAKNNLDLKILDLNCYDAPGYTKWKLLYESPEKIIKELNGRYSRRNILTVGGYGIPMFEYYYRGIFVRLKDTHLETTFAPVCYSCDYFPCQEGIYHLTITTDGCLKLCRHRPDLCTKISIKNKSEMQKDILYFLKQYYFCAKRFYAKKQVFQGYFGAQKERPCNVGL